MTHLPSPLAYVLETTAEVRRALRVLPALYDAAKYQEASDLVDDCARQLEECWRTAQDLTRSGDPSQEVLTDADPGVDRPPLTLAGASPGEPPDLPADQPLW